MFTSIKFEKKDRVATITLNRPSRMNAIDRHMPSEIRRAVQIADRDDDVHVIILQGEGKGFCAGYDLVDFAENPLSTTTTTKTLAGRGANNVVDPTIDYRMMSANTEDFMSLWRCSKPTIAKVHGYAVAGGSDIALCCDLVVMADNALIGYPPSRIWGIPTTMQWIARVGPEQAKRMLFTGDLISGTEAKQIGLVLDAVPAHELDQRCAQLAQRISAVPRNQLHMSKMVVNSVMDLQGLKHGQMLATFFDGFARNSPEGMYFSEQAHRFGFKHAIQERDGGNPIAVGVSAKSFFFEDAAKL